MLQIELLSHRTALAVLAAAGYGLATFLMKLVAQEGSLWPVAAIAAVLAVTVAAEILLLREVDIGIAYIIVIGVETLLVLGVAYLVGEPLSGRELTGGAIVVAGLVLVSA